MRTNTVYCAQEDFMIDRHEGFYPSVGLFGEEGEPLGQLPASWTDDQIRTALRFANKAYAAGYGLGYFERASDIRDALGIKA